MARRLAQNVTPLLALACTLLADRGQPRAMLYMNINPVGRHAEGAWRAEFPRAIAWLFQGTERARR